MFSETLKRMRQEKGMTQRELAKELGVNLRTLQYYEQGTHIPRDLKVLERISAIFDIPVYSLVNNKEFYKMLQAESLSKGPKADRRELYRLLQELTTLFAGGTLSPGDRELFLEAVTSLVLEADE
ncbi:MAG: helix-turn-helix transcriptional regulator [Clostridia bacterium]|nr:helix-turn-helix transcriptional regulator [Clostridia bacterium]